MRIYMIWGQLRCDYPGQYAPDLIDAWSEYTVDDNPSGFVEAVASAERLEEYEAVRVIVTTVDGDAISRLLTEFPEVKNSGLEA